MSSDTLHEPEHPALKEADARARTLSFVSVTRHPRAPRGRPTAGLTARGWESEEGGGPEPAELIIDSRNTTYRGGPVTPAREIAEWMWDEFHERNGLIHGYIVRDIRERFGEEFIYRNKNGNFGIRKDILREFRRLTEDEDVVWSRGIRVWRKRRPQDPRTGRTGGSIHNAPVDETVVVNDAVPAEH